MRLIPILTAIIVTAFLYMLVIERDSLLAFARGAEEDTPQDTATAELDATAEPSEDTDNSKVRVVALRSSARVIDSAVILRGRTQAKRQVEVRAETTATVINAPLRKGIQVQAGEALCELDPGTRPAQLAQARARLAEAKAKQPEAQARLEEAHALLKEAQINLTASQKLSKGGFASETTLAGAEASERTAIAAIASAEAGLESTSADIEAAAATVGEAEKEMERLTILAPFDGLLESDTAELGSLMQAGSLCATVIQLDEIKLVGFVPEAEVDRVEIGALANAKLATGADVQGRVTFVSRSADPETRTFEIDIVVPNADLKIRDGQTADIVISADGAQAHKLPQSSLTLNKEGRLGVRIVGAESKVEFVPITLLRDTVDGVWLTGLPDQADVIIVGQDFVTHGVPVAATYKEAF
ncbi:efflux RND transporter periplasmic adaptor subunit [Epibacterium ulvae]|uniref:efflux RND transporter periplasmic adaptor subunit n=1 Tax=Epibacterium ulvae TaxID=1156985 RepID=UPI001BFC7320|nr:efflux RND transporter periplasmic adaptor subunit [Epibacterium ulvae]MBT8155419.1 efflux RND transporter periplasmic adaptor subunit [Epibacterium ulvae]